VATDDDTENDDAPLAVKLEAFAPGGYDEDAVVAEEEAPWAYEPGMNDVL
jgi:hypothetical protein